MTSALSKTDDEARTTYHGIPAREWFKLMDQVITMLCNPDQRHLMGLQKIDASTFPMRCEDPNCQRLSRRLPNESPHVARYRLIRDLSPVLPSDPGNRKEDRVCSAHPWQAGTYICDPCARVAFTKRLINQQKGIAP